MPLYKITKTGAIQEWNIEIGEENGQWYYEITHGQKDGKKQVKRNYVKGKNIGKANETTPEQQAKSEALSKRLKQLDGGYGDNLIEVESGATSLLPMLAHEYTENESKILFPAYLQPKLDGVRCLAYFEDNRVYLISRKGKPLILKHISDALCNMYKSGELPEATILDGELYHPEIEFQQIVSLIKKEQIDSNLIEFHVYDCIDYSNSFANRFINGLQKIFNPTKHIKIVETREVKNSNDVYNLHTNWTLSSGYEGSIIRHGSNPYEVGKRSRFLLKLKNFQTEEFVIHGAKQNVFSPETCVFILHTKEGYPFDCMPTGTHEQRKEMWINHLDYIGKLMTVKFFEWTTSEKSVPRFPVGLCVRDYE